MKINLNESVSESPVDLNIKHRFGILIEKPQFNFNNYLNFNQTIFTSKQDCFVYMDNSYLKYDFFSIDTRHTIKMIFKELELYNGRSI